MTKHHCKPSKRLARSKVCQERKIKVNKMHYEYRTKDQSPGSGCRCIPSILMKGHWLRLAGFEIDTPIKIRVMDQCLVVTVEE